MNFQFSILRLMVALSMVGVAFALLGNRGVTEIGLSIAVGIKLVVIAMTAGREDYAPVFRLVTMAAIGGMTAYLLFPISSGGIFVSPEEIQRIENAILGAALGSLGGLVWNLATRSNSAKRTGE